MITTLTEIRTQNYSVPKSLKDVTDMYNIDGYAISKELGLDLSKWGAEQLDKFQNTKSRKWELDELQIRLMLFYIDRLLHFTGYTYHEYDKEKDTLLQRLAELKEVEYIPLD